MSTSIEWTRGDDGTPGATWNPVRGCSRVSEGCRHCYAERTAARFRGPGQPYDGLVAIHPSGEARWTGAITLVPEKLGEPLRWQRPKRVFVNSMSDLFHEGVPDEFIASVFSVMASAHHHTFQVLTKRPERMRDVVSRLQYVHGIQLVKFTGDERASLLHSTAIFREDFEKALADGKVKYAPGEGEKPEAPWIPPNIWLGVSCEDQATADERIPLLLQTPAAVRFVSAEPLLELVDLCDALPTSCGDCEEMAECSPRSETCECYCHAINSTRTLLDWVIVGGESGPRARPCDVTWIRSIVEQCRAANVSVFCKQMGAHVIDRNDRLATDRPALDPQWWPEPERGWDDGRGGNLERDLSGSRDDYQGAPVRIRLRDRKGGSMEEWPEDLRVREFPTRADPARAAAREGAAEE